jgi:glycosyltransferase involved in cell wall biosynthesis
MKVVYFHRKRYAGVFSIESLFSNIRNNLPKEIDPHVKVLSYVSRGFLRRFYITIEAIFYQGNVNHVTGDVNFICLFLKRRKTILTIHDVGYMKEKNVMARWILLWFWIRLPVSRSVLVTTVSEATKSELLKFVNINPAKIQVVHVPVSQLFIKSPKSFNKAKPIILQIGTKVNKNVTRLILALKDICCKLDIVGEISQSIKEQMEINKIEYAVSENLTDKEIVMKYQCCDIVSFVSTHEGFGMPIVEANAVGRVVVTSNLLSMPEVAGGAAHLVDPFSVESIREGIIKVINDDHYRESLINNGFKNKIRFEVKEIAKIYSEIYKSVYEKSLI